MFILILVLPLFSFLGCSLLGHKIGHRGAAIFSLTLMCMTVLNVYCIIHSSICLNNFFYLDIIDWISTDFFFCRWELIFDSLSCIMLCVITTISFLVHIYSVDYMGSDPHLPRFLSYLSLFTFFMVLLVLSNTFIQMFIGWEGVGFCSYLLINFWYTRLQANKSAIKAMLVNRVSDFALILGIFTVFFVLQGVNYELLYVLNFNILDNTVLILDHPITSSTLIGITLFLGAMGKSAQIFLHTWLPDAMEGPTPVSALIHAATMVTAGVFLIIRCSVLYEYSPEIRLFITLIGASTAFYAATISLTQHDIKKVIAYSTCSQLGYMVFSCGLSQYNLGLFHLFNHAFFKALLFLSAGSVIHAMSDEQDIRKYGGLRRILPFTYSVSVIGSFALMGVPFLAGFYSKDIILEVACASYNIPGHFAYWLGLIGAGCTAFYSIRVLCITFLINTNAFKQVIYKAKEPSTALLLFPLSVLAVGSIFIGWISRDIFIGFGSSCWNSVIYILPQNYTTFIDSEFLNIQVKVLPLIISVFSAGLSFYLYTCQFKYLYFFKLKFKKIYIYLNKKWFFDKIYNTIIGQFILYISYTSVYRLLDKGFIEYSGPTGLLSVYNKLSNNIQTLQTGYLYHYTLVFVSSVFFLISFILYFIN